MTLTSCSIKSFFLKDFYGIKLPWVICFLVELACHVKG
jgi:hypothetical protein